MIAEKAEAGRRRAEQVLDPRAIGSLLGAVALGSVELVTESIRLGGAVVGDLGDLFAERVDRAAGGLDDRLGGVGAERPTSGERVHERAPLGTAGISVVVDRALDGAVDVLGRSIRTFEDAYERQRRLDERHRQTVAAKTAADDQAAHLPIPGYDALEADVVVRYIEALTDADQVRIVLAYEQGHQDRKPVVVATESHLAQLLEPTGPDGPSAL